MIPALAFVAPSTTEIVIFAFAAAIPSLFTILVVRYVNSRIAKGSVDK